MSEWVRQGYSMTDMTGKLVLVFHLSMVACPTSRGFIAARWSFSLLLLNIFGLALSALFVG